MSEPEIRTDVIFARNPNEAMDCLTTLIQTMNVVIKRASEDADVRRMLSNTPLDGIWNPNDRADWAQFVSNIPVYWWSTETASLVLSASHSYPMKEEASRSWSSQETEPPAWHPRLVRAICVFESPVLYMLDDNGQLMPLSAIAWLVGMDMIHHAYCLQMRGIEWLGAAAQPSWWSDGGTSDSDGQRMLLSDPGLKDSFNDERLAFAKWICAASMFIEQEIVAVDRLPPGRKFRKRLVAADPASIASPIHVIRLRKETDPSDRLETESVIDWSCRWTVRGHWRRQFFPSRGANCPIWIHPHVKGPEDKPFKAETPIVHAVVR